MRSLIKIPQYSCYNAYERLDTLFLQHDTLGQKKTFTCYDCYISYSY